MAIDDTGREQECRSSSQARAVATGMLARREHSRHELSVKLGSRHFDTATVAAVLDTLADEGLQSDARFAEAFVRSRVDKGRGPVRIQAELRERGVDATLIEGVVDPHDPEWRERMERVRRKRFGASVPRAWPERARQMRFLQYRGFSAGMVRRALDSAAH